jgi:capsular polysaccharide biosynthesis protein
MNNNHNNTDYEQADEISLQDLFMALWRQKILIIVITLVAAIVTGIISVFAITPVYHAKLNIIMNMPEIHHTKYGDYTLPISTNEQYINLITSNDILINTMKDLGYDAADTSIESLRDKISIVQTDNKNAVQNSFDIRVASDNPEKARKLAEVLYLNYIEFIDVMVAEGATTYFSNYYDVLQRTLEVQLETDKQLLEKNTTLLNNTPMTINQREAMDEILSSENLTDFIIMGNIINPNYTELELDIIEIKQAINITENTINQNNLYLDELDAKQSEIVKFYESGEFTELKSKIVRITKSNIYLPSDPVAPTNKTSPSNARNVIIGTLLGGMVSVLIALVREFWFKKEDVKNE